MSFTRPQPVPRVPTPPQGDEIAAYPTYLEAQQAVDYLSDNKFPVENVTIVGTDLKMVERVTGRLTYGRVALAGAMSGAWFGLFVGLLLSLFGGGGVANGVVFIGIALGAGFGLLFSVLSYALTGGRRDFTSQSQIVATTYAILCAGDSAGDARALLLRSPGGVGRARAAAAAPAAPSVAAATTTTSRPADPRWTTPTGEPRYGAMRSEHGAAAGAGASSGGAAVSGSGAGGSGTGSSGAGSSGGSGPATPSVVPPANPQAPTPPSGAPSSDPYAPPPRQDDEPPSQG